MREFTVGAGLSAHKFVTSTCVKIPSIKGEEEPTQKQKYYLLWVKDSSDTTEEFETLKQLQQRLLDIGLLIDDDNWISHVFYGTKLEVETKTVCVLKQP